MGDKNNILRISQEVGKHLHATGSTSMCVYVCVGMHVCARSIYSPHGNHMALYLLKHERILQKNAKNVNEDG